MENEWWFNFWRNPEINKKLLGDPEAVEVCKELENQIITKNSKINQCYLIDVKHELKIDGRKLNKSMTRLKKMNIIKLHQNPGDARKIVIQMI